MVNLLSKNLVLIAALASFTAQAQDCPSITQPDQRLACFDQQQTHQRQQDSLLSEHWELDNDLGEFLFRAYKPVYFLPIHWSRSLNTLPQTPNPATSVNQPLSLDSTEASFQLSFKTKLANNLWRDNGDLWLGYTQQSHWQIYNGAESRPFRETNHEPELLFVWRTDYQLLGYSGRMLSLSFNHQSNGREEPLSRSWNRVIATVGFDRPDWAVLLRPWYRLPEASAVEDENADIEDYLGRGEVMIVHRRGNTHQISARLRHSLKTGNDSHGSLNLNWSYPCFDRLRCHAKLFHGYAESLIDYNHSNTSVGLGISLLEWLSPPQQ